MQKFSEGVKTQVVPVQDANPAVTSAFVDVATYREITAIISAASQPAAATLKARLVQAKDATGLAVKDLVAEVTKTNGGSAAASDLTLSSYTNALDHVNGYGFVAVRFETSEAAGFAGATLILSGGRFQ